jgi:hypothetical protein
MAIVKVDLPLYTGLTTLELAVYQDGVRVNSDGNDALEETENSFGRFTAEVSQSLSGTYEAVIVNVSGAAVAFGYFDSATLLIGETSAADVVVYPIQSTAIARVIGTTLTAYVDEAVEFTIMPTDSDCNAVDTTGLTLEVVIENRDRTDVTTIADGSITKGLTSYSFTSPAIANATVGQKFWSCRRTDNDNVISLGPYVVEYAATGD